MRSSRDDGECGGAAPARQPDWTHGGAIFLMREWAADDAELRSDDTRHTVYATFSGASRLTEARVEGSAPYRGRCAPGNVSFIPAGRQRWSAFRGAAMRFASLRLEPDLVDALLCEDVAVGAVEFTPLTNGDDPLVHALLSSLQDEARRGGAQGVLFVEAVTRTLALHLIRTYASLPPSFPRPEKSPSLSALRLRRLEEYVDANLSRPIGMADMAAVAGLSPSYLARALKRMTGLPPYRYVLERRIRHARTLLADTDLPLVETALRTGFADQAHFTKMFKRRLGTSPGAFRATHRLRARAAAPGP